MKLDRTEASEHFPSTRWSLVLRASHADTTDQRQALTVLLRRYQSPLPAHLLAERIRPEDADDLLHGSLIDKIVEGNLLPHVDQTKAVSFSSAGGAAPLHDR